jgi:hypothetical protein
MDMCCCGLPTLVPVRECEGHAIEEYMTMAGGDLSQLYKPDGSIKMRRWARLRLPNGQIARSAWKLTLKPLAKLRMARNVKVSCFYCKTESVSYRRRSHHIILPSARELMRLLLCPAPILATQALK